MLRKKTIEEVAYLLEQAEEAVGRRAEKIMLELYWKIGYCLREYHEEEIIPLGEELSILLGVEAELFDKAYRFYKGNPIKKKALRVAA